MLPPPHLHKTLVDAYTAELRRSAARATRRRALRAGAGMSTNDPRSAS